jgi:hypothetical protein
MTMPVTLWHFQDGDRAAGPVDASIIRQRLRDGRMPPGTLVWCEGMPEWARVEITEFAADVPLGSPARVPPDGSASPRPAAVPVSATPAWIIALLPLGFLLLLPFEGTTLLGLAAYVGLAMYDREQFKRAGRTPSNSFWWMILLGTLGAPVYLYLRAERLGETRSYFITSLLTPGLYFALALSGAGSMPH